MVPDHDSVQKTGRAKLIIVIIQIKNRRNGETLSLFGKVGEKGSIFVKAVTVMTRA